MLPCSLLAGMFDMRVLDMRVLLLDPPTETTARLLFQASVYVAQEGGAKKPTAGIWRVVLHAHARVMCQSKRLCHANWTPISPKRRPEKKSVRFQLCGRTGAACGVCEGKSSVDQGPNTPFSVSVREPAPRAFD